MQYDVLGACGKISCTTVDTTTKKINGFSGKYNKEDHARTLMSRIFNIPSILVSKEGKTCKRVHPSFYIIVGCYVGFYSIELIILAKHAGVCTLVFKYLFIVM